MFISTGQIIVPILAQRTVVFKCFFCCSMKFYTTVSRRICLRDAMSRSCLAMFYEGLPLHYVFEMSAYILLGHVILLRDCPSFLVVLNTP